MLRTPSVKLLLILTSLLFSINGFCAANDEWVNQFKTQLQTSYNQYSSGQISKSDWIEKVKTRAPAVVCQRFSANKISSSMLKFNKIDSGKCATLMSQNLDQCIAENSATIPALIDKSSQDDLNKKMGICAVEKFLTQNGNVSKALWLDQFKTAAPALLCQSFIDNVTTNNVLTTNQIDLPKCETLISKQIDQCVTEYTPKLPAIMNLVKDSNWANQIGECSAKDFFNQYGSKISKDQWTEQLKTRAPVVLCQMLTTNPATNKLLLANKIDYSKCLTLVPANLNDCVTQYSATMPAQITMKNGIDASNQVGSCAAKSFIKQYGVLSQSDWLANIKTKAPEVLCQKLTTDQSTQKVLTAKNIDYQKCLTLVPQSLNQCITNYSATLPAQMTLSNEGEWGKTMGQCTLKDFYSRYLSP